MAFESTQVKSLWYLVISTTRVKALGREGRVGSFVGLRPETSKKRLYMSHDWYINWGRMCDNCFMALIFGITRGRKYPMLQYSSPMNRNIKTNYKDNKPGRITNKSHVFTPKRHFSVRANLRGRYEQWTRKYDRKEPLESREVQELIEKIKASDKRAFKLYTTKEEKESLFPKSFSLAFIDGLLQEYNSVVTKLTLLHLNNSPARVTQLAMEQPAELRQLSRLQNVFIESFTVAVLAVDEIFGSNSNGTQDTDKVAFKKVSEVFNQLQVHA